MRQTAAVRARSLPSLDLLHIDQDDGGARLLLALAGPQRGERWLQTASDPRPEGANRRVAWPDRRALHLLALTSRPS